MIECDMVRDIQDWRADIPESRGQNGILLGIFPDRQQYEFRIEEDGPAIYGPVSEGLD
jgi:hypothetical protein